MLQFFKRMFRQLIGILISLNLIIWGVVGGCVGRLLASQGSIGIIVGGLIGIFFGIYTSIFLGGYVSTILSIDRNIEVLNENQVIFHRSKPKD